MLYLGLPSPCGIILLQWLLERRYGLLVNKMAGNFVAACDFVQRWLLARAYVLRNGTAIGKAAAFRQG